ncbi:MAG: hypothetical protein ABSD28_10115 [Tepidisphaeraceae bacterium]
MAKSFTPFPIFAVCTSAFLALCGLWMILRPSRRRVGIEPRCHHCDYILIGITSERCPECGTVIDPRHAARGHRRSRRIRVITGLVLLSVALAVSWSPVENWSQSIYWYQYRPTFLVMQDLEHGNGRPAPANNPLERAWGHGWLSERVDLARVALDELLRRDKLGKLSPEYRHQIDEMALADLSVPITAPVQYYLNDELGDRLIAGKLTADEQATIYRRAIAMTLSARPIVMQWDDVPIRVRFQTCLPSSSRNDLGIEARYKSVRIDGEEVEWSRYARWGQPNSTYLGGGEDVDDCRQISYSTLGQHRIDVDMQIDVVCESTNYYPRQRSTVHSELHRLSTSFVETKPTLLVKIIRFVLDPEHELGHYLPVRWLNCEIASGPVFLRDLGIIEMIRRGGLGELTTDENDYFVDQILAVQKDRAQPWNRACGDYIESQRAANKLPEAEWRQYGNQQLGFYMRARPEIRQGDPLPFDVVTVARRGNSKVGLFSTSQWTVACTFSQDIPRPWELDYWNGINVICTPQDRSDYMTRYVAKFPESPLGLHTVRAKLKYNLAWTERPQNMQIPTEYDLGEVAFTIVPRTTDTIAQVDAPSLRKQIEQCIVISDVLRWKDGRLTFFIDMHRPPVDLAFHVSVEAGNREWKAGDIFAEQDSEVDSAYASFNISDAKQMPAKGLILKFTADSAIARQLVGHKMYWKGDIAIGGVSIGDDEYLKSQQ